MSTELPPQALSEVTHKIEELTAELESLREFRAQFESGRVPAPASSPNTRRVNVNFSEQAYETLERLARRSGKSMSEILRESIALKAWFENEHAQGNKIWVENTNGKLHQVIDV